MSAFTSLHLDHLLHELTDQIDNNFPEPGRAVLPTELRIFCTSTEIQINEYRFSHSSLSSAEISEAEHHLRTLLTKLTMLGPLKERRDWAQLALTIQLTAYSHFDQTELAALVVSWAFPQYRQQHINTRFMCRYATKHCKVDLPKAFIEMYSRNE
jgi:hypothetical protein